MGIRSVAYRCLVAVVALVTALGVTIARPVRVDASAMRFATRGRWIVDQQGRTLLLRGVNIMGLEYTPASSPLPWDDSDLRKVRATGATVVRVPISWAIIEPQRGHYDAAALARITTAVRWASDAGLLVVLDMHQWNWSPCFGGNGVPEWASSPCPHATAVDNANAPSMFKSETAFWLSRTLQARFTAAWRQAVIAARAAGTDNVLGYEILNEPPLGLIAPGVFENAVLAPFYERNARAIRKLDPGGLIFVEPILGSGIDFGLVHLSIARLVYSTHLYQASVNDAGYHAGDFAGPAQFLPDLLAGGREAARLHAAYWPGEWGYLDPTQTVSLDEARYARDMLTAQDIARVGSAYWTYNRHDPAWNPAIVSVLTRPSPFAVAGDLLSMRTKPNSVTVTWRQRGSASSRFSLPAGWTPRVQATPGVTVIAEPGGWLDVSARPGSTATVVITRAN
jgi:hypothetical protein